MLCRCEIPANVLPNHSADPRAMLQWVLRVLTQERPQMLTRLALAKAPATVVLITCTV